MSGSEQNGGGGGTDQESHHKVDVNREVEFLGYIDRTVFRLVN